MVRLDVWRIEEWRHRKYPNRKNGNGRTIIVPDSPSPSITVAAAWLRARTSFGAFRVRAQGVGCRKGRKVAAGSRARRSGPEGSGDSDRKAASAARGENARSRRRRHGHEDRKRLPATRRITSCDRLSAASPMAASRFVFTRHAVPARRECRRGRRELSCPTEKTRTCREEASSRPRGPTWPQEGPNTCMAASARLAARAVIRSVPGPSTAPGLHPADAGALASVAGPLRHIGEEREVAGGVSEARGVSQPWLSPGLCLVL